MLQSRDTEDQQSPLALLEVLPRPGALPGDQDLLAASYRRADPSARDLGTVMRHPMMQKKHSALRPKMIVKKTLLLQRISILESDGQCSTISKVYDWAIS